MYNISAVTDPCKAAPRNPGVGDYKATRWAFDSSTRKCIPFEYRGMKGNANNFISRESCEVKCPVFLNPCKVGDPFQSDGRYQVCNPESPCPARFYCHVGEATNYCCPMLGGDPCGQPMDRGTGGAQLQRWYWNVNQQCCLPFSYCGLKGTQNNFLSRTDCERTCYELDNPCAGGEPLLGQDNRPLQCPAPDAPVCGNVNWCHIGGNQQTTVCCPNRVNGEDICQLPLVEGDGDFQLDRFYFDSTTRQCLPFVYKGRLGNQNNFLTQEACENLCPVFVNVCPMGQPLLDSSNRPIPCTFGSDSCGDHHWCHLGLVPDEYQCCPGTPTYPGACQDGPFIVGNISDRAPPAQRWYYDKTQMKCLTATYNGRAGSQNNFLTKEDCEATCEVYESPCNLPISLPATSCQADNMCGPSQYCHFGLVQDTTVCCPSEGDACSLPLNRGQGQGSAQRWYYDQNSYSCLPFQYAGTKGNSNNFLTQQACEERCGPNPCFEGRPFQGADGRTQTCTASASINTCPASYWCHVGADMSLTVCCPGASTNVCNLPMSTGEGNYNLDRYYFDSTSRTCRPFKYNGLKGNQNNFLTLRSCQLSCQPLDNPCIGQPAVTAAGQVLFCSATNKDACPINFYCHIGASPETTVCCPGATNPCSVPLAPGTGIAGLPRYYYNPDDRQCEPFTYNGKRGNQNNFLSQTECERTCPVFTDPCLDGEALKKTIALSEQDKHNQSTSPQWCDPMRLAHSPSCPRGYFCLPGDQQFNRSSVCCPARFGDPCEAPLNEGHGNLSLPRFYYSSSEGACHPFAYRGSKGNENNFLSKHLCEESCAPVGNVCFGGDTPLIQEGKIVQCISSCPIGYFCHRGANPRTTVCCRSQGNPCDAQLMPGVGDAELERYFYDTVTDECVPFNYTGIGGNENNFMSKNQCQIACPGLRGYCPHGRPHSAPLGGRSDSNHSKASSHVVTSCGVDIPCLINHVCHVTRRTGKSVCCPDPASFCILPIETGRCSLNLTRFAYDRHTGSCTKYYYSGCGGNLNNFESLSDLISMRYFYEFHKNKELCLLSIDRGACANRVSRYAFDRQTNQCIAFEYTGCGGNLNNFASYEDCESTCAKVRFRR
ncbi:unnamed protein product, partial [Mesorhabditis belari]|uniref:BPTI/Kunitz inhibitor domain-containing protein n=1 Tax=Mesorhabditis belari TaxID=2138241 RepID=A0AAF3EWC2_9BILA